MRAAYDHNAKESKPDSTIHERNWLQVLNEVLLYNPERYGVLHPI